MPSKRPKPPDFAPFPPTTPLYSRDPAELRIATYHRASTVDQDPGLATAELTAWAARHGRLAFPPIEESASGMWNARPELQRLLTLARRGQIDCVAVWKLDRFGRSALDVLANVRALADAGCEFVAVTQGIRVSARGDAMSTLMLTVLAAVAEFERSLIVERTRLGMAKAKAKGIHCGRPRHQNPSPQAVAALRAEDKSWNEIAEALKCGASLARKRYGEHVRGER
ncbi:MAG: Resolvase-like protein [bacterium]|nr:Resolvase-like protein [bacterium]